MEKQIIFNSDGEMIINSNLPIEDRLSVIDNIVCRHEWEDYEGFFEVCKKCGITKD